VIDWGLAKVLASPQSRSPGADPRDGGGTTQMSVPNLSRTEEGLAIGTPAYMAPEQAGGAAEATEQSDVFGLGGILCFVLTGRPPHKGTVSTVIKRVRSGDVAAAAALLDGCGAPGDLVALAKACLSPDAAARPKNAGARLPARSPTSAPAVARRASRGGRSCSGAGRPSGHADGLQGLDGDA